MASTAPADPAPTITVSYLMSDSSCRRLWEPPRSVVRGRIGYGPGSEVTIFRIREPGFPGHLPLEASPYSRPLPESFLIFLPITATLSENFNLSKTAKNVATEICTSQTSFVFDGPPPEWVLQFTYTGRTPTPRWSDCRVTSAWWQTGGNGSRRCGLSQA